MRFSPVRLILVAISAQFLVQTGLVTTAATASDADKAIQLYQRGDYKGAVSLLQALIDKGVADVNEYYYAALAYQGTGNYVKAQALYRAICDSFPDTEASRLSQVALEQLKIHYQLEQENANDSLPKETWVPYSKYDNRMLIDANVNHRPVKMLFDTGAEGTVFGMNHIRKLGLPVPSGKPDGYGTGVGGQGATEFWFLPVTLKIGNIERRNFPISITHAPQPAPLLGQDFYHGYQYEIDETTKCLSFRKNISPRGDGHGVAAMTVTGSSKYVYNIPFLLEGNRMVVRARVNGHECDMTFDTGASICFFTKQQLEALGLTIHNAKVGLIQGVAGATKGDFFTIDDMQVGPVQKHDVWAASAEAHVELPLLGQSFFGDYNYSIDSANKVIRFSRK